MENSGNAGRIHFREFFNIQNEHKITVGGAKRGRKPTPVGILDRELAKALAGFILRLAEEFDLTGETAKSKSHGVKWFRPHKLTGKDGLAKVGGAKLSGSCRIDRYVSYGVGGMTFALCAWLPTGAEIGDLKFHVFAPEGELGEPKSWHELRPNVKSPRHFLMAQEFTDLNSAEQKMRLIIGQHADRI